MFEFTDYMWGKLVVVGIVAFVWGLFGKVSPPQQPGRHDTNQIPEDRR